MLPRAQANFAVPRSQPQVGGEAQALSGALSGTKQGLRVVHDAAQHKLQKRQAADDAAGLIEFENNYKLRIQQIERETAETIPQNGDGFVTAVRDARGKARDELMAAIPSYVSEDAKTSIGQLAARLDGDSDLRATRFQDDAATAWVVDTLDQSVQTDIAAVLEDPNALEQATRSALTRLSAVSGRMTPEQEMAKRDQIERDMSLAQVTGLARSGQFEDANAAARTMAPMLSLDEQFGLETSIAREKRAYDQRLADNQKAMADQASIMLAERFITGSLTEQDILDAAPALGSGTEARTWYTALDTKRRRDEERYKDFRDDQREFLTVFAEASLIAEIEQGASMSDVLQSAFLTYSQDGLTNQGLQRVLKAKETTDDDRYMAYTGLISAPFEQGGIFAQFDEGKEIAKAQAKVAFLRAWPDLKDKGEAEINAAIENITARAGKDMVAALPEIALPSGFDAAPRSLEQVQNEVARVTADYQERVSLGLADEMDREQALRDIERLQEWETRMRVTE